LPQNFNNDILYIYKSTGYVLKKIWRRISRSPPNTKKPLNCGFFVFGVVSPFLTHVYRYAYAKHAGDIVSGVVGMNM
jgi:hypothetical protein